MLTILSSCGKVIEVRDITKTILLLRNKQTGLPPSHYGHAGYEKILFSYDLASIAMILHAAGHKKEAEKMMDYIVKRFNLPARRILNLMDANNSLGILKMFRPGNHTGKHVKTIINAMRYDNTSSTGLGYLEYYTTPGPMSFFIMALLNINTKKYLNIAVEMGKSLLSMQDTEGGVRDGDRVPDAVNTEPHSDAYSAFIMLYSVTTNKLWLNAANKAFSWFKKYVYLPDKGIIHQGSTRGSPNKIFATDAYSWVMAGALGDKLKLSALKKLTDNMLKKSLVKITLKLPDNSRKTIILVDFTDPLDKKSLLKRRGFHPLGSMEWAGGVILALQKNAVRFWNDSRKGLAKLYKGCAQILLREVFKGFYLVPELKDGALSFYATGQGVNVGHGWRTPYYFIKDITGNTLTSGGSLISSWPVFPKLRYNPFIYKDPYKKLYDLIEIDGTDRDRAEKYIKKFLQGRSYTEKHPNFLPKVEMQHLNINLWRAFNKAQYASTNNKPRIAKSYFKMVIHWASIIVSEKTWMKKAIEQNKLKQRIIGGIIWYPWGQVVKNNNLILHSEILRYPMLNEMAIAMWGLAVAHNEIGQTKKAKYWIKRIIKDIPLHQIPAMDDRNKNLIKGYWNAIYSWETIIPHKPFKKRIKKLYFKVLKELRLGLQKPVMVHMPYDSEKKMFN